MTTVFCLTAWIPVGLKAYCLMDMTRIPKGLCCVIDMTWLLLYSGMARNFRVSPEHPVLQNQPVERTNVFSSICGPCNHTQSRTYRGIANLNTCSQFDRIFVSIRVRPTYLSRSAWFAWLSVSVVVGLFNCSPNTHIGPLLFWPPNVQRRSFLPSCPSQRGNVL